LQSQLGQGSVFWFEVNLPEAKEWATAYLTTPEGTVTGYQGDPHKVLIVDDRWENRAVLQNLLEPIGFSVLSASDGKEGLAQIATTPVDLVITDLAMPVMDGFEMLKQLRQNPACQNLPVIVSSASVFEIDQDKSIAAGGNSFLAKPVQADELLQQLQAQLHLDWIYETAKPFVNSLTPAEIAQLEEIIPPSVEILMAWTTLIAAGDLFSVQEEAQQLSQIQPQCAAFASAVIQLAEGFQSKKLNTFIQQYLNPNI
jgi:CheY-like chemotaxis protein